MLTANSAILLDRNNLETLTDHIPARHCFFSRLVRANEAEKEELLLQKQSKSHALAAQLQTNDPMREGECLRKRDTLRYIDPLPDRFPTR